MRKLLSLFAATMMPVLPGFAFIKSADEAKLFNPITNTFINYINENSEKHSISNYNFKTVIIDEFNGLDKENLLDEVFLTAMKNNPEHQDFIVNVSEYLQDYKITGNDFEIPTNNKSNTYNLKITASSDNTHYSGTTVIKVILIDKKVINIHDYQQLFSTKIKQLSLKAIGHATDTKHWQKNMLEELDKKLIENNADMYEFDGKNGHDTLFVNAFENNLIKIDFGKPVISDFSEKYNNIKITAKTNKGPIYDLVVNKTLNIIVDVTVKKAIDISTFKFNFLPNVEIFAASSEKEWKKEIFATLDIAIDSFENESGKPRLFFRNIDHLDLRLFRKNKWNGVYETYTVKIFTASYVQDDLLPNKSLTLQMSINKIYPSIEKNIKYSFNNTLRSNWSSSDEKEEIKEFPIYKISKDFEYIEDFNRKYSSIDVHFKASYDSDWPASKKTSGIPTFLINDLKDKNSTNWKYVLENSWSWAAMYLEVKVGIKVFIRDYELILATKVWHKIKIDGAPEFYLTTKAEFLEVILHSRTGR